MSYEAVTLEDVVRAVQELAEEVGRLKRKLKKQRARCRERHGGCDAIGFKIVQDEDDPDVPEEF